MSQDAQALAGAWDEAAEYIETDPMRSIRYGKCLRYLADLDRNSKILEIGCGEGTGLLFLQQMGFHHLAGVEVSAERVRRARLKLDNDIELYLVGVTAPVPMEDNSVDAAVSLAVIEHAVNPREFIRELARVVRPGGYVVISSDCYSWRILQILGIYRSVQPIDKAMFPSSLMRVFKEHRLSLVHYEGFAWPGHELRFARLLAASATAAPKRLIRKLIPSAAGSLLRRISGDRSVHQVPDASQVVVSPPLDLTPSPNRTRLAAYLKLLFSDENVYFLVKQ